MESDEFYCISMLCFNLAISKKPTRARAIPDRLLSQKNDQK